MTAAGASDHGGFPAPEMRNSGYDKEYQEDDEQYPGDFDRNHGNASEAKKPGDQRQNEERKCITQHGNSPSQVSNDF